VPCPEAVAEQAAYAPSKPPAGTDIEKVMVVPDTVPDTAPVPFVPLLLSVSVIVPENDAADCESVHVIRPAPDESVAVPDHDPLMLTLVDEGDEEPEGVEGDVLLPPLHPLAMSARRAAPARTPANRGRIMVKLGGF